MSNVILKRVTLAEKLKQRKVAQLQPLQMAGPVDGGSPYPWILLLIFRHETFTQFI
jgi:hypothetical protein